MSFNRITIKKLKGEDIFSDDNQLSKELACFNYYIIQKEEENLKEEKITFETQKLKLEVENKFTNCISKFLSSSFDLTNEFISLCFENNCFLFRFESNRGNNKSEESKSGCGCGCAIHRFLFGLLLQLKKIEILFSKISSATENSNYFFINKEKLSNIKIPGLAKLEEIQTEVSNLKAEIEQGFIKHECFNQEYLKHGYQNEHILKNLIKQSLDSILIYLIRRNYYKSKSFKNPSFFKQGIVIDNNKWENIIVQINIETGIESNIDITEKLSNIGLISMQEISNEDIIILRPLFNGSFSQTKLVINRKTFKLLVQKIYCSGNFDQYDREKEIYMDFKYQHPNILRCYGFNETKETKSLFLEFMSNDTLKTFSRNINTKNKITKNMKYHIIINLIFALEYLYNNNVIHRDLKPDNIVESIII